MKQSCLRRVKLPRLLAGLGVCGLLLASILLSGCQSQAQSALPPATQVAAAQPAPATAQPPLNNPAPPPTDKPTVAQPTQVPPTVAPTLVAPTQAQALQSAAANPNRKAVEVTVFHVNDVMGETDPCG